MDGQVRTDGRDRDGRDGDWSRRGRRDRDGFSLYINPGWGWGYPYYGYRGYYPYSRYGYGGYGYGRPYYYDDYGYGYSDGYYDDGGYAQGQAMGPSNVAGLEVQLPAPDAEVWLQGQKQTGSGSIRRFYSPPLEPGRNYTYTINAAWYENGELVTQKRQVDVRADALARVDFTGSTEMAEQGRDSGREPGYRERPARDEPLPRGERRTAARPEVDEPPREPRAEVDRTRREDVDRTRDKEVDRTREEKTERARSDETESTREEKEAPPPAEPKGKAGEDKAGEDKAADREESKAPPIDAPKSEPAPDRKPKTEKY